MQSYAIFWVTFVVTSKNNTRNRHSVKHESYLSLFMLVSRANETLRRRHKVNETHSPVLSMGQKSAQLPYFKKVQHLKEKSRPKNIFTKVLSAVANVYLGEKNFGG